MKQLNTMIQLNVNQDLINSLYSNTQVSDPNDRNLVQNWSFVAKELAKINIPKDPK